MVFCGSIKVEQIFSGGTVFGFISWVDDNIGSCFAHFNAEIEIEDNPGVPLPGSGSRSA